MIFASEQIEALDQERFMFESVLQAEVTASCLLLPHLLFTFRFEAASSQTSNSIDVSDSALRGFNTLRH